MLDLTIGEDSLRQSKKAPRAFLGVMFKCCHIYCRIYKNKAGTAYEGNCPRCMKKISIAISANGSSGRFFEAR